MRRAVLDQNLTNENKKDQIQVAYHITSAIFQWIAWQTKWLKAKWEGCTYTVWASFVLRRQRYTIKWKMKEWKVKNLRERVKKRRKARKTRKGTEIRGKVTLYSITRTRKADEISRRGIPKFWNRLFHKFSNGSLEFYAQWCVYTSSSCS
jgi:hypothetical protein